MEEVEGHIHLPLKKSKQSKHVNLGRENRPRIILVSVFTGFTGTPINIQTWLQGNQNHA